MEAVRSVGWVGMHASVVAYGWCTYRYSGGIFMHQLGVEMGRAALHAWLD